MYEFQDDGIQFLQARDRALLGDEPGLGKSRQLLLAAEGRTLVLAPAMVLDAGVWTDEHAKWRPDLDLTQAAYTTLCKREKTPKGGSRPIPVPRPEFRDHWDTVIFDESHYLKSRNTIWTKAAMLLQADRTYCSTGTPIPNWAHELFTTLQLLYPNEAKPGGRFGSYWRWVKTWFKVWKPPYAPKSLKIEGLKGCDHGNVPSCPCWVRFHDENLGDRFLQRLRDDVLTDLPPIVGGGPQRIFVDLVGDQKKAYREIKKDFITWVGENEHEHVAWNSAAQTVKLAKIATGLEILEPTAFASGKFAYLETAYRDRPNPMLVVAHFRRSIDRAAHLSEINGRRTVVLNGSTPKAQRRRIVKDFQDGRYDTFCATIDTVREGLTLTRADTVIRLERSYLPSRNDQVIRRIHRIGQTRPVTILDLITRDTNDEHVLKLLAEKTDEQMKALRPHELLALVGA